MKLLLITTSPLALHAFFRPLAHSLRDAGFDLHAAASPGPVMDQLRTGFPAALHEVAMPRSISPLADLRALARLCRLIFRIRPRIVHAHTPKAGLLGMIAARLAGVPARIYTVHGLPLETRTGWRRALLAASERIACICATEVIAVSESVRSAMRRLRLCSESKVRVIGTGGCAGVDLHHFDGRRMANRPEGPVLLFAGRFVRDKGFDELAEAWQTVRAEFPEARLRVCGEFEPQDPPSPVSVQLLRGDPRVEWSQGFEPDMRTAYAAADLLVLPTYREGLPTVVLEAAAMGLPVVATRVTGCVDAVRDGETGILVEPRDPAALARALAELLRDPERRSRMGRAARVLAEERFSAERVQQLMLAEYLRWSKERPPDRRPLSRMLDIAGAALGLLLTAPILAIAAAVILATMGRPVLFRQDRAGLHGRVFRLNKLRTMANGEITPVGGLLRATSIDELPQLWNVLRGEMALVGPRPLLAEYLPRYSPEQMRRHDVKPGLTGWAQVHGRNAVSWAERFEHDLWYVEHRSFRLDLRILALTFGRLIDRGETAMPEFRG